MDHWRERFKDEEDDIDDNEDVEDPVECGEDKENTILEVVLNKVDKAWFNGTSEDEDDLEGMIDYIKPKAMRYHYSEKKAYNERKGNLHKIKVLGSDEMPRTRDNIARIRAGLMEEIGADGSTQGETLSFPEDVVNRILQVVLDLQRFKSSPFIFTATILQSSSSIHHISNNDNMYIKSCSFRLFSSLPGVLTPVRGESLKIFKWI
ncbi:hypothetical protein Tco_1053877 [Tanacetum coccineum]|uniref:Uncharacterized protein n=1 Tax=Tanacetum coccineum TaxID=301880 RepID=A0ABQ5GV72_9ASTR